MKHIEDIFISRVVKRNWYFHEWRSIK